MADVSEQRETTNTMLNWGVGLGFVVVVVAIFVGVFATMHANVNNGVNNINNGTKQIQQQGNLSNVTL